jgi:hypothetical protein
MGLLMRETRTGGLNDDEREIAVLSALGFKKLSKSLFEKVYFWHSMTRRVI